MFEAIEKAKLTWKELMSVLLDIEITLNNRPLGYIEDDIQTPILTPNLMILGQPNFGLESDVDNTEDCDLKKRATYTCMVTLDKGVPERLEGATQPHTKFQGTEIKERICSDHTRRQEKQSTMENWDCPSAFIWARRYHYSSHATSW